MSNEKGNRCRVHFVCGGVTQCKFAQPVGELECAYLDGKECLSAQAAIEAINEEQKEWTMPQTTDSTDGTDKEINKRTPGDGNE